MSVEKKLAVGIPNQSNRPFAITDYLSICLFVSLFAYLICLYICRFVYFSLLRIQLAIISTLYLP